MSLEQAQRNLNQIEKDIATLEKKLADLIKKEANKAKRIHDIQRSINNNTSTTALQSKKRQMQNYSNELTKISKEKAMVSSKIAEKRKKHSEVMIKLQKEELNARKKADKERKKLQDNYEKQIESLKKELTRQKLDIERQIPTNLYSQESNEEYDVFVSHASEDKEGFVDEFIHILQDKYGISVWYDSINIGWGESLRAKIDEGLKRSKFGIVVLSKYYIDKGWTQYELDGLFQREMTGGKIILPIWHKITKDEVMKFSPTLAGRKALNTAMFTTDEIAQELKKILDGSKNDQ